MSKFDHFLEISKNNKQHLFSSQFQKAAILYFLFQNGFAYRIYQHFSIFENGNIDKYLKGCFDHFNFFYVNLK
jgi:hypothetical protein